MAKDDKNQPGPFVHDETTPGGKFLVNGKLVNSEGQPIDENGKILGPTPAPVIPAPAAVAVPAKPPAAPAAPATA